MDDQFIPTLAKLYPHGYTIEAIGTGMADGADTAINFWAIDNLPDERRREYPANWVALGDDAGPVRNRWMLRDMRPNLLLAFPGFDGTRDMLDVVEEYNSALPPEPCLILKPKGTFK